MQNISIKLIIKNQPFSAYKDTNGNNINLWYNVSSKGHYGDYWRYFPAGYYFEATDNEYDIIDFGLSSNNGSDYYAWKIGGATVGGQVDFQVQAFIGFQTTLKTTPTQFDPRTYDCYLYTGETSDWSSTHTITIGQNSSTMPTISPSPSSAITDPFASSTQNPTATPQQPSTQRGLFSIDLEQIAIILLVITVVALAFVLVLSRRRRAM